MKVTIKDLEKRIKTLEELVIKKNLADTLKDSNVKITPYEPQPPYNYPIYPPQNWNPNLHWHNGHPCTKSPCWWC